MIHIEEETTLKKKLRLLSNDTDTDTETSVKRY